MRLEGKSKLGYYPTPMITLARLITWLGIYNNGFRRFFDPCCGEGTALASIASAYPAETVGVELSDVRAAEASRVLDKVLNTSYESIHTTPGAYSLVLLNPPYDGESMTGGGKRMEETFLIEQLL